MDEKVDPGLAKLPDHGLITVCPSNSGKTCAWRVFLAALERLKGIESVAHVIDYKAILKEAMYGVLDQEVLA